MTPKCLWSGILIIALSVALATPARADQLNNDARNIVIGIVAVTATVAVLITVLVLHRPKNRAITGCVASGENGMTVTDARDRQVYALSGNTTGIKPGDRMTLQGKKRKANGPDKTVTWETTQVVKDYGVCQP